MDDILAVARLISVRHDDPSAYGYGPQFERLVADWGPRLFDPPEAGRAWPATPERSTMLPPLPFPDDCSGTPLGSGPALPWACEEGTGH